jgi:toxin YoeB
VIVEWNDLALEQFRSVLDYWKIRNQSNAYPNKLLNIVDSALDMVKSNPEIGIQSDKGTSRSILIESYRIFYSADTEIIHILLFWDIRQNPDTLLELLNFKR